MTITAADLVATFNLAPAEAVKYFRAKGYVIGWDWHETWKDAHARAFTVAGVLKVDALVKIRESLATALAQGQTFSQWKKAITPELEAAGLLGRHALVNPETGEAKTLTSWRLRTIYQTNLQTAYNAGRWAVFAAEADRAPYVQYLAVGDSRTRPSHQALNGKVFRIDDPAWSVIAPPNGFNCRCRVRNMDQRELDRRGLRVETDANIVEMPAARHRGDTVGTVQRGVSIPDRNDPTGKKRTGLWADVGWDYNPGASWLKPFAPPPLDDLPRTFAPGVVLPGLPTATRVKTSALLPDGLAPEEYARAFLAEFDAEPGRGLIFEDAAGGALAIDEALFKDGAGKWKVNKNGRAPYLRLIAQAVKAPDEIWLRWEALRDKPGAYSLKRRYIKSFEIEGEDGTTQFGLGVFEFGKDGWTGSTAMVAKPDRSQAARERYIQAQRDGFLLFRK